jgi:aspartyl-tRNA(Asn)/glutamyl-tRNA(Gln) amidotransferase subunit C
MNLTRETVQHIAALARLRLSETEIAAFEKELAQIISYMEKLNQLNTANIQPTAHVAVDCARLRSDSAKQGLSREAALAQAPRPRECGFAVPAFVDDG